jgi:hypothetical protein
MTTIEPNLGKYVITGDRADGPTVWWARPPWCPWSRFTSWKAAAAYLTAWHRIVGEEIHKHG